jgi:hypothetical protein
LLTAIKPPKRLVTPETERTGVSNDIIFPVA